MVLSGHTTWKRENPRNDKRPHIGTRVGGYISNKYLRQNNKYYVNCFNIITVRYQGLLLGRYHHSIVLRNRTSELYSTTVVFRDVTFTSESGRPKWKGTKSTIEQKSNILPHAWPASKASCTTTNNTRVWLVSVSSVQYWPILFTSASDAVWIIFKPELDTLEANTPFKLDTLEANTPSPQTWRSAATPLSSTSSRTLLRMVSPPSNGAALAILCWFPLGTKVCFSRLRLTHPTSTVTSNIIELAAMQAKRFQQVQMN